MEIRDWVVPRAVDPPRVPPVAALPRPAPLPELKLAVTPAMVVYRA